MKELDASSFEEAIAGGPLLVDFWAPWCRPCRALEPILGELEATIPVAKVNVDEQPALGARYDVLSIPTVILFAGGERIASIVGIRPRDHFDSWLAEALACDADRNGGADSFGASV